MPGGRTPSSTRKAMGKTTNGATFPGTVASLVITTPITTLILMASVAFGAETIAAWVAVEDEAQSALSLERNDFRRTEAA